MPEKPHRSELYGGAEVQGDLGKGGARFRNAQRAGASWFPRDRTGRMLLFPCRAMHVSVGNEECKNDCGGGEENGEAPHTTDGGQLQNTRSGMKDYMPSAFRDLLLTG